MAKPAFTAAESYAHTAAVCRAEATKRRSSPAAPQRAFAADLERWAANFDRRAAEARTGSQPDLFERHS